MLSLHDLRAPAVFLDWHESVAVAASLSALLIDARADACPAVTDVVLLPSGELRLSGPALQPGPPAAAVAGLLAGWLDASPGPAELAQLARSYAADDRTGSGAQDALAALLAALAFYERPGREGIVASLVARVAVAVEQARRVEALEALTARTRVAAGGAPPSPLPPPSWSPAALSDASPPGGASSGLILPPPAEAPAAGDPEPAAWGSPAADNPWRLAAPAAAAIMVFVGMAYLAASWLGDRSETPSRRPAEVEEELAISGPGGPSATPAGPSAASVRRPAAPRSTAPASVAPASTSTPAAATTPVSRVPAPSGPPDAAVPPSVAPARSSGVDVAVAEREGRVVASPIAPVRQVGRPAPAGRIFTSGDPQVTPAILIRPHLPEQPPPDVPEEHIGTLEFVVAESGAVEHVHLISPANRYQERMLVAAAKTWQFQPATREGRPVRFRTRVRVTL